MIASLIATIATAGAFRCAIITNPRVATSADKRTTVVVLHEGKVLIYHKGSSQPKHITRWSCFGHHQQLVVSGDGSAFAIYDVYGGMEVFEGEGKLVASLEPRLILSQKELSDTPGKWTCHGEGTWLEKPSFEFKKGRFEFTIYNGRKVTVDL